jgi:hypothetical protein
MFAVAVDGELVASRVSKEEVVKILKVTRDMQHVGEVGRIEVASFEPAEGWVPVCIERFWVN